MSTKTAITPTRQDNYPEWYQQIIKAAELAENAPVRGCMVIRPWGYGIWENIQKILDQKIKECDVENAYFPLLIPLSFLEKEAEHVEGFAKECAVVTHHRLEAGPDGKLVPAAPLAEPLVIRPTSETIIGDSFSKWVQSYRDLPLKINQWANVMRWEMRPRLFLRTSEFLWQEGHTVHATAESANGDARLMLDVYADFSENHLAIPVIKGEKTADERFPGAIHTYTIEAMMQDGKALQAGTSHDLGQNFAKSSEIKFLNEEGQHVYAHTTSWGVSTRMVGGLVMTHGDDDGMIVPPQVAPHQMVILPLIHDEAKRAVVMEYCEKLKSRLQAEGIRVFLDRREDKAPNKSWHWIKKGVPVRIEIGGREVEETKVFYGRRDLGLKEKQAVSIDEFVGQARQLLAQIQSNLFNKAKERLQNNIHPVASAADAIGFFKAEKFGFVSLPLSEWNNSLRDQLKSEFSATARCIPFDDQSRVIIANSY